MPGFRAGPTILWQNAVMSTSIVLFVADDAVAMISINEPETRNALSRSVMNELIGTLAEVGQRTDVRAVILATAGHVFSSGHDLKEIRGAELESQQETFALCSELMQLIQSIPQPVIAQVQGVATAAGCQLVASCDLAVAAHSARFATPGVKIGLFCSTPMVALTRAVPAKTAMRMLLTGDTPKPPAPAERKPKRRVSRDVLLELRAQSRHAEDRVGKLSDMLDKLQGKLADPAVYGDPTEAEKWGRKQLEARTAMNRAEKLWMEALEALEAAESDG